MKSRYESCTFARHRFGAQRTDKAARVPVSTLKGDESAKNFKNKLLFWQLTEGNLSTLKN